MPSRPVLSGFHPDPSVCRVGDVYYLATSSFEYAPGVPVFRSPDLLRWELVGHALHRRDQLVLDGVAPSGGIYAPSLRHHDGRFWLVTTNVSDGPGHLLVTAEDAGGPWSEPVRITAAGGIDPDLSWDDAGTCYLTWSDDGIVQAELDPATGRLVTQPRRIWSGTGGRHAEGPHLHRVGEHWYLVIAEGGTGEGHAVTVARGTTPSGPFAPSPVNPLLTARGTPAPVQNTGHADLVQRVDGSWAAVFLGVRPRGYFPGWHVLGREVFAVEIGWDGGWPRVLGPIEPQRVPPVTARLGDPAHAGGWVGAGVLPDDVLIRDTDGWVLSGQDGGRTFVGRRQEHELFTVRARVRPVDGVGGLELRIDPTHAVTVEVDGDRVRAVARVGPLRHVLGEAPIAPDDELELRAGPSPAPWYSHERGPDEVVAALEGRRGRVEIGRLDGRYLSTEVAGGFTGRMVGLVCERGRLAVRSLVYEGRGDS